MSCAPVQQSRREPPALTREAATPREAAVSRGDVDVDDCLGGQWSGSGGRQTPIAQRRPLQRISLNTVQLSPTKRRKQSHSEECTQVGDALKAPALQADECVKSPVKTERRPGNMWHEVLARLGVRDIVDRAAPVCKLWREVAHSKELWGLLRPHVRLVDQLLVCEKVVERRSKGRLFRCQRLGSGETVLLRVVDLELTNAGKDDGVPTSFLREAALLTRLRHPNVIRHFGAEVLGKRAIMCTEYVHENFSAWFKRLENLPSSERCLDIRGKFNSLLEGVSYLHHQGVMHRNLKPDNIFMDLDSTVRIGDFTTTRMLDVPLQAYTPEDPKERDRSGREMRRLWYRAPELIMRDEIYGPKVDMWSVGCLLAEAATGRPLFQSESEIDHLFRVFRVIGTPTISSWPEVVTMKSFSPKFPLYSSFSLAQVADAACNGNSAVLDGLMRQAQSDRVEVLQNLLGVAAVLGVEGTQALESMLRVPPPTRSSCDEALAMPFFAAERGAQEELSDSCPPAPAVLGFAPARMIWDNLHVMKQQEEEHMANLRGGNEGDVLDGSFGLPRLPPGFMPEQRTVVLDYIVGMANTMSLTDYTLHLAAAIFDKYLALQEHPVPDGHMQVVGATCLKIADVFAEQSKEYYKQENASEYEEASSGAAKVEQVLKCEKDLLPKLNFDLHMPTMTWFLRCYITYARFNPIGAVAKTAAFIADLTLLDYSILVHAPSLRAQCSLLIAVYVVEEARALKRRMQIKPTLSQPPSTADDSQVSNDGVRSSASAATSSTSPSTQPLLQSLRHWNDEVRDHVCRGNTAVDAALALQAVVRTLVVNRRDWKSQKFDAVELRHAASTRALTYPERFPVSKLVRYILPDSQRGMLAE